MPAVKSVEKPHATGTATMALRLCALLLTLIACACIERSPSGGHANAGPGIGPKNGKYWVVGWVPMDNPKNEYWKAYDNGLQRAVEASGGELLYNSPLGDPVKQSDCILQLITQDVDILLVYPIDSNAVGSALKEANGAGIPVGLLWNPVPKATGAKIDLTVAINAEEAAARAGQVLVDALVKKYGEAKGKVLEVQGRMVTTGGKRRGSGFHRTIDKYSRIQVTAKPGDWDTGKGTNAIQQWITAHPDTDAIFFHSDGAYTPAAAAALSPLSRWVPAGEDGHIICTGIDGSNMAVHAIKHGFVEYTSGTEHADMGKLLGELAMEYLETGALPQVGSKVLRPDTSWTRSSAGAWRATFLILAWSRSLYSSQSARNSASSIWITDDLLQIEHGAVIVEPFWVGKTLRNGSADFAIPTVAVVWVAAVLRIITHSQRLVSATWGLVWCLWKWGSR